jgi:hypothetical protein
MRDLALYSDQLASAYSEAAQEAARGQDIAAFVTIAAAGATVAGAVGSASNTAIANAALVGAGTTVVASRTVSQDSIKGLYIGSKRMNCISTAANMGRFIVSPTSSSTIGIARAATYGAIREVQISVREGLVRKVADYTAIKNDLIAALPSEEDSKKIASVRDLGPKLDEIVILNQYLHLLNNCLQDASAVKAAKPVKDKENNSDKP